MLNHTARKQIGIFRMWDILEQDLANNSHSLFLYSLWTKKGFFLFVFYILKGLLEKKREKEKEYVTETYLLCWPLF